jgi:hypothetical protein
MAQVLRSVSDQEFGSWIVWLIDRDKQRTVWNTSVA